MTKNSFLPRKTFCVPYVNEITVWGCVFHGLSRKTVVSSVVKPSRSGYIFGKGEGKAHVTEGWPRIVCGCRFYEESSLRFSDAISAINVHYSSHSFNLAVSDTCTLPEIRNVMATVKS